MLVIGGGTLGRACCCVYVRIYHRRCIWSELVQWFCDVLFVLVFASAAVAAAYLRSDMTFFHESYYCAV